MPNPDKSGRQNMLREEIQTIQDIHGHNPMFATIRVHFGCRVKLIKKLQLYDLQY